MLANWRSSGYFSASATYRSWATFSSSAMAASSVFWAVVRVPMGAVMPCPAVPMPGPRLPMPVPMP